MKKLIKFVKNNRLIIPPFLIFVFFIVIGIVIDYIVITIMGIAFMIFLIVALMATLKDYE